MSLPVRHRQPEQYNPVGWTLYRSDGQLDGQIMAIIVDKARYGRIYYGICQTSRCTFLILIFSFLSFLVISVISFLSWLVLAVLHPLCILANLWRICCYITPIPCVRQGFPDIITLISALLMRAELHRSFSWRRSLLGTGTFRSPLILEGCL